MGDPLLPLRGVFFKFCCVSFIFDFLMPREGVSGYLLACAVILVQTRASGMVWSSSYERFTFFMVPDRLISPHCWSPHCLAHIAGSIGGHRKLALPDFDFTVPART